MPMPVPNKKETRDDYVSRFMENMKSEYADDKQRLAVALSEWRKHYADLKTNEETCVLVGNISGLVRDDELDGVKYLVAPVVMLEANSLNGIFYPEDEIQISVESWNMKPVTINHPTYNGRPVSAANKKSLEAFSVGFLMNTSMDRKLRSEAWFNLKKADKVAPGFTSKLRSGELTEVSTGLMVDVIASNGVAPSGLAYNKIAYNLRPDHLAVLLNDKGALSVSQGAGVPRINKKEREMEKEKIANELISNKLYAWSEADRPILMGLEEDVLGKLAINEAEIPVKTVEKIVEKEIPIVANTANEWADKAPEAIKITLNMALGLLQKQINDKVEFVLNRAQGVWTREDLAGKTVDELDKLEKALSITANAEQPAAPAPVPASPSVANFMVNAVAPLGAVKAPVAPLPDPWVVQK